MRTLALLALCLAVAAAQWPNNKEPWFCHDINCPEFNTGASNVNYDVRTYTTAEQWVSTTIVNSSPEDATTEAFMRLFKFIDGGNAGNTKIEMTAPVRSVIQGTNNTVSFYLPFIWQKKTPPKPTDDRLFFSHDPANVRYAVTSYSGYSTDAKIASAVAKLKKDLTSDGVKFDETMFIYAGYDPPYRLFNRHNEVWMKIVD